MQLKFYRFYYQLKNSASQLKIDTSLMISICWILNWQFTEEPVKLVTMFSINKVVKKNTHKHLTVVKSNMNKKT